MQIIDIWVDPACIESLYAHGHVKIDADTSDWPTNSYILLKSEVNNSHKAIARYIGDNTLVTCSKLKKHSLLGVQPKDVKQAAFLDCLTNPDILINTAVGSAGTGKTTLALAYALQEYISSKRRIYLSKPTTMVGKNNAFGPVPGDISEKYGPYLDSYFIILEKLASASGKDYFKMMQTNGDLKFIPIAFARGCTYENTTFIIDEAQNLTWHELNSIMSRLGENSKCLLLGDPNQIDTAKRFEQTGFHQLISSQAFKQSALTSSIKLTAQYRSPITKLMAEVDEEIRNKQTRDYR